MKQIEKISFILIFGPQGQAKNKFLKLPLWLLDNCSEGGHYGTHNKKICFFGQQNNKEGGG
jgi:hypothetical protein